MKFEHFLMFSSTDLNLKKFKLLSRILGIQKKYSPRRPVLSNLFMDRVKLHVNICTKLFISIYTLFDKLAIALKGNSCGDIADAIYF